MLHLVVYSDSSSDDEDRRSNQCSVDRSGEGHGNNNNNIESGDVSASKPAIVNCTSHICPNENNFTDLPITDESDDQCSDLDSSKEHKQSNFSALPIILTNNQNHDYGVNKLEKNECKLNCNTVNLLHSQLCNDENVLPQSLGFKNNSAGITSQSNKKSTHLHTTISEVQSHILTPKEDLSAVLDKRHSHISDISTELQEKSEGNLSCVEVVSTPQSVETESIGTPVLSRKRKLSCDRDKQLPVPDVIHSMFHDKQQKWVDDPSQHHNRSRSFPHLEGNWATHIYIRVARTEPFVRFVDQVLELLMPHTFQAQQDFHVSLSRTVTIRYHWIEPLVDSLRENLKSLKSCISDLTAVKLFTNDDKTRTFVSIELSQEEQDFLEYVRAVDKSFAEFKLPAYYKDPSFHISVGWCLGDAVEKVSAENLRQAQELLAEFIAANPIHSFVYAHEICCQSGCKSFVITLRDLD